MDGTPAMIKIHAEAIVVAMAAVGFACAACSKSGDDKQGVRVNRSGASVALELAFPAAEISNARSLLATVSLRNASAVPVWLNERMSFNDEVTPGPLRELWIRVKRHDGTPVKTECIGKSLPAKDSDYRILSPGKAVSTVINVSCLNLSPGDYQLIARFADANEHPPLPPSGAVSFVGQEIQSPIVSLKVH